LAVATVVAAAWALAGCGPDSSPAAPSAPLTAAATGASAVPGTTKARSIEVDGVVRTYLVHVPANLAGDPALVVMMHGAGGTGRSSEAGHGWDETADAAGFVVAYPDGLDRLWNAGDCCGRASRNGTDDVGFITALVLQLQDEFGVLPSRTFATGMSNGAMMTYRLACDTDLFQAVAPVAGTVVTTCEHPHPVSLLAIHGTADQTVRLDGQIGAAGVTVQGLPVAEAVAVFRTADRCGTPVATTAGPVTTQTAACPDDRTVTLISIAGAGHQWPGATSARDGADTPSAALDATATIWEFFAAA
jgi:polyhydroxybutyrate depolymerase